MWKFTHLFTLNVHSVYYEMIINHQLHSMISQTMATLAAYSDTDTSKHTLASVITYIGKHPAGILTRCASSDNAHSPSLIAK